MANKAVSESSVEHSFHSHRSKRGKWNSNIQFILTCVGYSVGLGNVWRFPLKAYENGGGAFLIPYLCCSLVIGFPVLFLEMTLGQFSNSGPGVIFRKLCPIMQGIGWGQATMSFIVSIYYNVIVAWTLMYMAYIVTGNYNMFARCDNDINTPFCYSNLRKELAFNGTESKTHYFYNGTIHDSGTEDPTLARERFRIQFGNSTTSTAAEEFFNYEILQQTESIDDFGEFNWKLFIALAVAWLIVGLCLIKGVKWIGRVALVTATVPYVIICILFVRSVSLPGAIKGIDYYLLNPDFTRITAFETWKQAATHVCFSLGIGFGGLLSLSSFNERTNNCYRDAAIVTFADAFMSVFGGTAVFSVLGFMATQNDIEIGDVVKGGIGLAFIAYPEAMSRMGLGFPVLAFLFFAMLFTLGISSQFGYAEVSCTAICDQFPQMRKHRAIIVSCVCFAAMSIGLIMCWGSGIYYFYLFNEYTSSFSLMLLIAAELIVVNLVYGYRNYKKDLQSMFGIRERGYTTWSKIKWAISNTFGRKGFYIAYMMIAICPAVYTAMGLKAIWDIIMETDAYNNYTFPDWTKPISVLIAGAGVYVLICMAIVNTIIYRRNGRSWKKLVCVQKDWPKRKPFVIKAQKPPALEKESILEKEETSDVAVVDDNKKAE
ncbi:hypothetical protein QR680_004783 [Steinernema hermaphroditum]|uniref:Transporter n=1 Tax=Steinernema hermaphroditum TaxID=289476 RepID=A0AA39HS33_9BILA|nr:hypothetical protein QR680_004783 [Steinernema hermaphroditum]